MIPFPPISLSCQPAGISAKLIKTGLRRDVGGLNHRGWRGPRYYFGEQALTLYVVFRIFTIALHIVVFDRLQTTIALFLRS